MRPIPGNPRTHRYKNNLEASRQAKFFGRCLAHLLATGDAIDATAMMRFPIFLRAAYEALDDRGDSSLSDEFVLCDRCHTPELRGYETDVRTRRGGELWCGDCTGEHASRCESCGGYAAYSQMATDDLCTHCYDSSYFTCDGCDRVLHNDEYHSDGHCGDCHYDDDDDGECSASADGLDGYHDAYRRWDRLNTRPGYPYANAPVLGVELEVYSRDRADAVAALRRLERTAAYQLPLILESDSSLDDDYGFEVVQHPMGLADHQSYAPALLECLLNNNTLGWDASNGTYGIHITVGRSALTPLQEARMMMFLCADDNKHFVQCMAQRSSIYSARVDIGGVRRDSPIRAINLSGLTVSGSDPRKKISGVGKYSPINFKDTLAEFRIFQSTLNKVSYLKNLEFVSALIDWTNPQSATGSGWHHINFLTWLQHRPNARAHYPNLVAFLQRDTIPVKGGPPYPNIYKDLLPRTTLAPIHTQDLEAA